MLKIVFLGLFEPSMFGSELDLCKNVVILALYREAIPIWSVGGSEIIVNMIFERFRASGVSGDEGKAVGGEIQAGAECFFIEHRVRLPQKLELYSAPLHSALVLCSSALL